MAVRVFSDNPRGLLTNIKSSIQDGSIETWAVDSDGDFTHSPEQWKNRAWFRPVIKEDRVVFRILTPKSVTMSRTVYAVYHGRFIEMLLTHFDLRFSHATATALPADGDIVAPST
jgi:hypothetical protein